MLVDINGQVFQAELYDNETTAALGERLPMTITMEAMNGNEKFYFLDESLPTNTETVGTIQKGDIMLYGSNCLVVFYKTFDTGYSYTRLGHIADTEALEAALGDGNVTISFRRAE
ncbi:MAG: cyclophilin-like fold protein [Eubacterium sp.]|nr:cyclophilin-like fold protein [Eubacterium sp.]